MAYRADTEPTRITTLPSGHEWLTPVEAYDSVCDGDFVEIRFGEDLAKIHRGQIRGACITSHSGMPSVRLILRTGDFKLTPDSRVAILERKVKGR